MINNINENFPNDLNDLINYGKWELSLISSLKIEKNYKKNLLLIDKEWLFQWKEITGYNIIRSQIFKYLTNIQKNKNNENILEENKKINKLWINLKQDYKINPNNLQKLKQINNNQYLFIHNNRKIINGKESFDIISNEIFYIFKQYLDKTVNIKVGGLFIKKKLLLPFNYNDKNINYIFIDMMFINNIIKKNDIEEILFIFPNLNLSIIEKIRIEISNKEINEFIKEFGQEIEKEFYFYSQDGIKYSYIAFYKKHIQKKENNKDSNNINNEIILNKQNENGNSNEIKNIDINNLTFEELEKKIKEIEEKTIKLMEIENNLNNDENRYLNEKQEFEKEKIEFNKEKNNKKLSKKPSKNEENLNKDIYLIEENNKYIEQLKEIEFKIQHTFDEIQECKEKEIKFNIEYKKYKNESQEKMNELNKKISEINNKENMIKIKDDKLKNNTNKKENEIKSREKELEIKDEEINEKQKELEEKEKELEEEEIINKKKENEIMQKNEEYLKKLKKLEEIEKKNNEQLNNEIEDEVKELEGQIKDNDSVKLKQKNKSKIINKKEEFDIKSDDIRISLNDADSFNFRKMKSLQQENIFSKINGGKNSINLKINKENNNTKIEGRISHLNFISSKTLTSPNIDDFMQNKKIPLKISIDKPSLGLTNQKKIVNLNSIIQCFAHLKEITEGILNLDAQNFFEDVNKFKLSKAYLDLINNLFFPENFNNKSGVYSISSFYDIIVKENKINLGGAKYCNSEDLLNAIINGLHKELNTKKNIIKVLNSDNDSEDLNEEHALIKFLDGFTKNNNSIISKHLFGLLKNKIICQGCKKEKYNFKCYSCLNFNLQDIKRFINKENQKIKLKDFFDYYNRPEYLLEEKGLFCNNCKSKNTTTILKSIYSSHIIMPIIIDRGDDSDLCKDKIDFPNELDLSKYIEYKNSSKTFYLCGVVSNLGLSNNFGKFEAFCKMEKDGPWFCFDNEKVSSCKNEDVHNSGIQYILFYHKI